MIRGLEVQTEPPTKDKVWKVIRKFKDNRPQGEDNIKANLLLSMKIKNYRG